MSSAGIDQGIAPFQHHARRYDDWFDDHADDVLLERRTLETLRPPGDLLDVGCGTGRFSVPLGASLGVEPATEMARLARRRGVPIVRGLAEALPVADGCFDVVMMTTVLEFVPDVETALKEAGRVVRANGALLVAILDADSAAGRMMAAHASEDAFFFEARFLTHQRLVAYLEGTGFRVERSLQALGDVDGIQEGHGLGLWVVVLARRID